MPDSMPVPPRFDEDFVLEHRTKGELAELNVLATAEELESFRVRHGVRVEREGLNLESLYPLLGR